MRSGLHGQGAIGYLCVAAQVIQQFRIALGDYASPVTETRKTLAQYYRMTKHTLLIYPGFCRFHFVGGLKEPTRSLVLDPESNHSRTRFCSALLSSEAMSRTQNLLQDNEFIRTQESAVE